MTLLWLYCKAWGAHGAHILVYSQFWKFNRDHLRKVLFDISFADPDEVSTANDLMNLLKAKVEKDKRWEDLTDWSNMIYKASIESIPKSEVILQHSCFIKVQFQT